MPEEPFKSIVVQHVHKTYFYSEEEIAYYSRLDVTLIHELSEAGILKGVEVTEEKQRFSDDDLLLLRRIRRLYHDLGVNLEGIDIILRLSERLDALQLELELHRQLAQQRIAPDLANDSDKAGDK